MQVSKPFYDTKSLIILMTAQQEINLLDTLLPSSVPAQPQLDRVSPITVYYTHTPPSTPTPRKVKNEGPSGPKFCMRPHQTILTTTQHNFNPTIFWGGGGIIPNPHTQYSKKGRSQWAEILYTSSPNNTDNNTTQF